MENEEIKKVKEKIARLENAMNNTRDMIYTDKLPIDIGNFEVEEVK